MDMNELMKMMERAQSQMGEMEKSLGDQRASGEAGGGLVKVQVNGRMEVLSVRIDPAAIDPTDAGMLEDLVVTAVNRALANAKQSAASELAGGLLGGGFPGM